MSESEHLKITLIKRFLKFIDQIDKSTKLVAKQMLNVVKRNVKSVTGSNLRQIMLLLEKRYIDEISLFVVDSLIYVPVPDHDVWKINIVKELIQTKHGEMHVDNLNGDEIDDLIVSLCT